MRRPSAFWQAVIALGCAWLVFRFAVPPFLPRSLMITYMLIVAIGIVLYCSSDDRLLAELKAPILATLRNDDRQTVRWVILIIAPMLLGYSIYSSMSATVEAPLELHQVHPAPPGTLDLYGKRFDLGALENPIRVRILEERERDPEMAWISYREAVRAGSQIYYQNCFFCHGDRLEGDGHFGAGLDPLPTNFRDVGTIAQLQESFLFWRIATGGPGMPRDGMPWKSAMPVWHEMLSEEDIWNVIVFLYDNVQQLPRMWNAETSRAVSAMQEDNLARRAQMTTEEIYALRCAVCHGESGAGDGPAAEFLSPRPRDFTLGLFKFKTSPGSLPPRDEDLFNIIKFGLRSSSMPGWSGLISDTQIRDLVTLIKRFDIAAVWAPLDAPFEDFDDEGHYTKLDFTVVAEQESVAGQVPYSDESVARGADLFAENCAVCHGFGGRGDITSGQFLEDDWGFPIWPRDLTKPWSWRVIGAPGETDPTAGPAALDRDAIIRSIYSRISVGIQGTPMPAHRATAEGEEDAIALEDRWHVANFTYSLGADVPPPSRNSVIRAVETTLPLPDTVDDDAWSDVPATTLRLVPNVIKDTRLFTPLNDAITVRALYNADEIAFLLEINDRTESIPGGDVTRFFAPRADRTIFSDAVAIQFPKQESYQTAPVEKPLFRHGDPRHGTTIWYWNAGSVEPPVDSSATLLDASGESNPLRPRDAAGLDLVSTGQWADGQWRVLMKRPRESTDSDDLRFAEGQFIPISFANWDGNNGETGSVHTFTPWRWLLLPQDTNRTARLGIPAGAMLLTFVAGLVLVRSQRRQR